MAIKISENSVKQLVEQMQKDYPDNKVETIQFEQAWGNTALGYDKAGMDELVFADTLIVYSENGPARVYFGSEELAYEIKNPSTLFWYDADMAHSMVPCNSPDIAEYEYVE